MIKETNKILIRKEQEEQIELSTSGLIHEIKNPSHDRERIFRTVGWQQ